MTLSPLAALSTIQLASLTSEDLLQTLETPQSLSPQHKPSGDTCCPNGTANLIDESLLQAFEAAWLERLEEFGHLTGSHEERILKLQQEATVLKQAKDSVEHELKRQAAFLRQSRHDMEATYGARMQQTATEQQVQQKRLQSHLDSVATTSTLAQSFLPWTHFISQLEKHAQNTERGTIESKEEEDWSSELGIGKPSLRALYLVESLAEPGSVLLNKKQRWSAAYRVDQILLQRQIQMTESELERGERLAVLHEHVSALLNQCRVTELVGDELRVDETDTIAPPPPLLLSSTAGGLAMHAPKKDPAAGPVLKLQRLDP